jgi:hypothetical protein
MSRKTTAVPATFDTKGKEAEVSSRYWGRRCLRRRYFEAKCSFMGLK